jgi:YVTN family beta-propeller protein
MKQTTIVLLRVLGGIILFVAFGPGVLSPVARSAPQTTGFRLIRKVPLGGEGFWDYLSIDPAARRLYLSRGTHVVVVDADSGKVAGDIPDTPGVHGVAIASALHRGFVSDGRTGTLMVFDLRTLKKVGEVPAGKNPDGIIYDPASRRVFAFNGQSDDATAIDAATEKVAGTIPLGGKPEFAAADGSGHVYDNIEDKSELVVIDSRTLAVTARWPLAPCEEPSGLALDARHHRLFAGCHNKMMAMINTETGKVVATVPIGQGVDANRFDPATGLAFASCGDGTLTIAHEDSPDKLTVVDTVTTQRGARTMELDPKTHHVFLVTADFGPTPAPTREVPRPRPTILPDTFVLLEFGK